jgi:putative transposase
MTAFEVSERRACRALGVPRSSQRYVGTERGREEALLLRVWELAREHPRYGYRRIRALLQREVWSVNLKREHRLWRREGLEVPRAQRKRRRLGQSEDGCARRRAERPDHVWSYDFLHDQTADGRGLKMLPVVDELTRECLTIEVERSLAAEDGHRPRSTRSRSEASRSSSGATTVRSSSPRR